MPDRPYGEEVENNRGWGQGTATVREGREEGRGEVGEIIEGLGGHGQRLDLTVNKEFTRLPLLLAEGNRARLARAPLPSPSQPL